MPFCYLDVQRSAEVLHYVNSNDSVWFRHLVDFACGKRMKFSTFVARFGEESPCIYDDAVIIGEFGIYYLGNTLAYIFRVTKNSKSPIYNQYIQIVDLIEGFVPEFRNSPAEILKCYTERNKQK
jgi:hypothetical protein